MARLVRMPDIEQKLDDTTSKYHFLYIITILLLITLLIVISINKPNILHTIAPHRRFVTSNFTCPVQGDKWIVVTTIFYPTPAIHKFLTLTSHWNLIVIADKKTPLDWLKHLHISPDVSSRLVFLDYQQQLHLPFRILEHLPFGSYARKNLGYLIAIKCGAKIIFESDDDNFIESNDIFYLPKVLPPSQLPWIAFHRQRSSFINIYGSFGQPQIWPRGFPLDQLRNVTEDGWHSLRQNQQPSTNVYIQQYLADLDPDVDAIYRLAHPLSIGRIRFDQDQSPIALEPFTFSPYNTQNTITHAEAFWGLYLPITTTFRVCDIWRGYWVQRLLWDINGSLLFGKATVKQMRNSHSYIKDMDDEQQLYHQTSDFVRFLSSWSSNATTLDRRIRRLAKDIAGNGFWKSKEVEIIEAWIDDLHSIGYQFPSIVQQPSISSREKRKKRTAVCVTGLTECIHEGWVPTYANLRRRLQGEMDVFLFLSSSLKEGPVALPTRLKQVRTYLNSTVTVLYEDRAIDPGIPSDCRTYYDPVTSLDVQPRYFQQIWALSECFDLVKDYEQRMNVQYEVFVRARIDSTFGRVPGTLEPPNNLTILIPNEHHFGGYNDRFALGHIDLMEKYMRRWHDLRTCRIKNIHAESFLKLSLDQYKVKVQLVNDFTYIHVPHGRDKCH